MKQLCVVKYSICTEVQIPPLKTFLIGTGRLGGRILVVSPYTLSATTDSPQLSPHKNHVYPPPPFDNK